MALLDYSAFCTFCRSSPLLLLFTLPYSSPESGVVERLRSHSVMSWLAVRLMLPGVNLVKSGQVMVSVEDAAVLLERRPRVVVL
jgi:hypothetical protein